MIAAGEVVQRPSSVVKELVENAVDAGATQIDVVIRDAGRTLIQVIDNGSGMSPDEAVLCFERHATSKLVTAEDLQDIHTFGFRGEALASIAAVSQVTLRTRRDGDETGCEVVFAASSHESTNEISCPRGSNFAVRDLFYNVPARRKFLKSDTVEFRHIAEEFTRIALTRPDLGFSLSHNGKDIHILKPAKSLKFRVMDLLGSSVTGDIVEIENSTVAVRISGFVGRPQSARKTLGNQFFFVNGRYFRSPYFHKAVMNAYAEMMPEGLTPTYLLFLEVDPESVDVNISPTKTEMKFAEDSVIFQALYASVRETLGRNSFGDSIDFDTEGAIEMPQLGKSFEAYRPSDIAPAPEFDPSYNPFEPSPSREGSAAPGFNGSDYVHKSENYGVLFEQKTLPSQQCLILAGKYILTPTAGGLLTVNVRRARTRILYERMLRVLRGSDHFSQMSMFPVEVQIGAAQMPLIEENIELLTDLGFGIAPFGTDSISISALPEGYACDELSVRDCVAELLQILDEGHHSLPEMMQATLARRFAELGAAQSGTLRTPFEATRLLDELFACENSELTPSGKRISLVTSMDEIEKKF